MDWRSNREDIFRYMLVDINTMSDVSVLEHIQDGGTIDYNLGSAEKVSGSLPFCDLLPGGIWYLRVWSTSKTDSEIIDICHGTFIPAIPSYNVEGDACIGTVSLVSLLHFLAEATVEEPYPVAAGTLAVAKAKALAEGCGLRVISDASTAQTTAARAYEAGTSYLEIINDLLSFAGFSSVGIDPFGTAFMRCDISGQGAIATLADDQDCVFSPEVTYELDLFDVPNRVVVVKSSPEGTLNAVAENRDPSSRYSIPTRGRVIPYVETVDDIPSQAALQEKADALLISKTSAVESVQVEHSFIPYEVGNTVTLDYTKADLSLTGQVWSKKLTLIQGMPCSTRIRRFVRL